MTTTYCAHRYQPLWQVDDDGLGRLVCTICGHPITPKPTPPISPVEVVILFVLFLAALAAAGAWFWWTWLG